MFHSSCTRKGSWLLTCFINPFCHSCLAFPKRVTNFQATSALLVGESGPANETASWSMIHNQNWRSSSWALLKTWRHTSAILGKKGFATPTNLTFPVKNSGCKPNLLLSMAVLDTTQPSCAPKLMTIKQLWIFMVFGLVPHHVRKLCSHDLCGGLVSK